MMGGPRQFLELSRPVGRLADGKVIASGRSPVTVFHRGRSDGQHPFFICVGREDQPQPHPSRSVPVRHRAIHASALPLARFRVPTCRAVPGTVLDASIPDTGTDAQPFALDRLPASAADSRAWACSLITGVAVRFRGDARISRLGSSLTGNLFRTLPCICSRFIRRQTILGRGVLNRFMVAVPWSCG